MLRDPAYVTSPDIGSAPFRQDAAPLLSHVDAPRLVTERLRGDSAGWCFRDSLWAGPAIRSAQVPCGPGCRVRIHAPLSGRDRVPMERALGARSLVSPGLGNGVVVAIRGRDRLLPRWDARNVASTFGVTFPERGEPGTSVTFRAVPSVDFARNTARAVVTVSICHPRPNVPDNTAIGSVKASGSPYCGRIEPIRVGTRFTFRSPDYIIATISPRTPGRVVITGMGFDYAMGRADWYRRGVDHLTMRVIMKRIT